MKQNRIIRLVVLSVFLLAMSRFVYSKDLQPPSRSEVAGTWVGLDQDFLQFCRIEIDDNGTGICAMSFVEDAPVLYTVQNWSLDGFTISFDLAPADAAAEPITLKGEANRSVMLLEIASKSAKWRRKLSLVREEDVARKNQRAKEKIRQFRGSPKKR